MSWRKLLHLDQTSLAVIVISCGDTGLAIGAGLIDELKKHKVKTTGLAITTELENSETLTSFTDVHKIKDSADGFAKKLEAGIAAVNKGKRRLVTQIKKLLGKSFDGLLLVTTGSGATGISGTFLTLEILDEIYDLRPPVLTLLPEVFENSRVQFNAASFIYEVAYKADSRQNPIILLDNKPRLEEFDKPFREVAQKRISTIPIALADLLIASFQTTTIEQFDANVADLFDVIHTPGISVFVAENLGDSSGNVDSSRIEDVISDSVIDSTNLTKDAVFEARNAFIAIFNIDQQGGKLSLQTEFETQKLFREFRNTNPYVKFNRLEGGQAKLRSIIAGLPIPTRILQIMRIAKESRKRVLIKESKNANAIVDFDEQAVLLLENQLALKFKKHSFDNKLDTEIENEIEE